MRRPRREPPAAQPRVEAEDLAARFPPARGARIEGHLLRSPADLGAILHARRALAGILAAGKPMASDVIVWDDAPALAPHHTRLGGWPYRPAGQPWPARRKRPLTFIAQWYLGDSGDLLPGRLPGDLLLCFAEHEAGEKYLPLDPKAWHVEWQRTSEVDPTASGEGRTGGRVLPFQLRGVLCRLSEYPGAIEPVCTRREIRKGYLLATTQASRIGGTTWYVQRDGPRRGERLLVTLDSLHPESATLWPYPSREASLSTEEADARTLLIGDVGCLYVFLRPDGTIRWACDCY